MKKKIVILGAGGHAKVIADCINNKMYELAGFLDKDDSRAGELINGVPILGSDRDPYLWMEKGIAGCVVGVGHVGDCAIRNKIYEKYKNAGYKMITVVHPSCIISPFAEIKEGVVVMPGAIINANAIIGENSIINSNAVIEHDVQIGSGVHVAPGSIISGGSVIGDNTLIGAGSAIIQSVSIGSNTIIGAGSTVIENVPERVLAVGCPAKVKRKRD